MDGIVKHPYGIALYEDRLYWSDWRTHAIESCNKFTGKDHQTVVTEERNFIYGLHIYHSAMSTHIENPCSFAFCSDICLLKGNSYSCACPQGKVLAADKHTCHGKYSLLYIMYISKYGTHDVKVIILCLQFVLEY